MPGDPTLSDLFHSRDAAGLPPIDLQAVVRRSRRRRLPALIGAGSALALAIAGIGFTAITGLTSLTHSASSSDTASTLESGTSQEDSSDGDASSGSDLGLPVAPGGVETAPADKLNLCGGSVTDVAASATGLVLNVAFPDATAGDTTPVTGSVTLTNTGTARVTGYTAAYPAITLARDGIVSWHSSGPMIAMAAAVDLAPGESQLYQATFTPVVCSVEDDSGDGFREVLPPAPAGLYQVSAAIDFVADNPAGAGSELVTGPATTIRLR